MLNRHFRGMNFCIWCEHAFRVSPPLVGSWSFFVFSLVLDGDFVYASHNLFIRNSEDGCFEFLALRPTALIIIIYPVGSKVRPRSAVEL